MNRLAWLSLKPVRVTPSPRSRVCKMPTRCTTIPVENGFTSQAEKAISVFFSKWMRIITSSSPRSPRRWVPGLPDTLAREERVLTVFSWPSRRVPIMGPKCGSTRSRIKIANFAESERCLRQPVCSQKATSYVDLDDNANLETAKVHPANLMAASEDHQTWTARGCAIG